ncbi:hypothetical protein BpHYR1_030643 [Brachionus plicatilis]|uniref:Uncharacterized protein n=1 Tax=Brachionus plicatilis TaxID=10195 RepID=A0A3M7Q896_BRAPC|nr:hypothetical protein BpHYR1_030643 [Brachionus plicatilis]
MVYSLGLKKSKRLGAPKPNLWAFSATVSYELEDLTLTRKKTHRRGIFGLIYLLKNFLYAEKGLYDLRNFNDRKDQLEYFNYLI